MITIILYIPIFVFYIVLIYIRLSATIMHILKTFENTLCLPIYVYRKMSKFDNVMKLDFCVPFLVSSGKDPAIISGENKINLSFGVPAL